MAKFKPTETVQEPILVRHDSKVICLVEYEERNGGVVPVKGFDVTSGYEHRRGRDAVNGMPLLDEYVEPKSAGEVAYLAHASEQGWNASWTDLDEEQRESWRKIGSAMAKYLSGDELVYLY